MHVSHRFHLIYAVILVSRFQWPVEAQCGLVYLLLLRGSVAHSFTSTMELADTYVFWILHINLFKWVILWQWSCVKCRVRCWGPQRIHVVQYKYCYTQIATINTSIHSGLDKADANQLAKSWKWSEALATLVQWNKHCLSGLSRRLECSMAAYYNTSTGVDSCCCLGVPFALTESYHIHIAKCECIEFDVLPRPFVKIYVTDRARES